jgi:hypothetical protein
MDPEEEEEQEAFIIPIPEGYGEEGEEFVINVVSPEEGLALLDAEEEAEEEEEAV